uniref:6-cysteine protein n=1 Tax=Strongyloides papillosus TaxID=174720 RepID=A0A0N5BG49_STREA
MAKLLYLFLVWTISICTFVKCNEDQDISFKLEYSFTDFNKNTIQNGSVIGEKQKSKVFTTKCETIETKLFLFKIPPTPYSNDYGLRRNTKLEFSYSGGTVKNVRFPKGPNNTLGLDTLYDNIQCNLNYCKMGAFYYKTKSYEVFDLRDPPKYDGIFYVAYEATEENKFLFLMYLSKNLDKDVLDVVVCPHETWISKHSLSEYVVDKNDIIPFPKKNESDEYYHYYKISHYQDNSSETFLKCGHINQLFLPKIDVGYVWGSKEKKELQHIRNPFTFTFKNEVLTIDSNNSLSHHQFGYLLNSSLIVYHVLSPENNYIANTTIVGRYKNDSKLFSGQKVFVLPLDEYKRLNNVVEHWKTGYSFRLHPQFLVPNIETTLRLKVNGVVQKFKTAINSESMDTYTVDLKGMNNGPIGCHAVPDNMNHSMFEDFYEKRYQTDLFIVDEKTNKSIKVNNTKSLVSNSIYKCVLNEETSNRTELKANDIKETKFIIHLIRSINSDKHVHPIESNISIGIIFGVIICAYITVILFLTLGLVIYKILQLKEKKAKTTLIPKKLQSTPKSSSEIKSDSDISRIQEKSVSAGSENSVKTSTTLTENPCTSY